MYNYFYYILVVTIYYSMKLIDIWYIPIIIKYRHRARYIVYNKDKLNITKLYYYLYYFGIWIWLDDTIDRDYIDSNIVFEYYKYKEDLDNKLISIKRYNKHNIKVKYINKKIDFDLLKCYITYRKYNNFYYTYMTTTDRTKIIDKLWIVDLTKTEITYKIKL